MSSRQKEALQENQEMQDCTLDQMFEKLDGVLAGMEEETSLEESFRLYHQGMDMLKMCSDKIDRIEKQILILDEEGETHEF